MAKVYTQVYDISQPTEQRFWTPPFSDFKIGLKVTNKGEEVQGALSLKAGDTALSAEETEIDGFTIFPTSSTSAGSTVYTISAEGVPETMKLVQVTTGSTVFEIDEKGSGGGTVDAYTKAQTDALLSAKADKDELSSYATEDELSAKADATKQLPADLTSWITDGWTYNYQSDFTKLTTGFYDISPYCDYTVSAQYVYGWSGYYYTTYLFSYCTNGKTVFCHQLDGRDVMDGTEYEGNISGNPSCYLEVDTTKIPNDLDLGSYLYDSSVVDEGSVKWFAYVSQNMDGNAPYTLQELTTFGDNDPRQMGDQSAIHVATEDVTPGFVEVSAVYGNEISGFIDQQGLTSYVYPLISDKVNHEAYPGEYTPPVIYTMTTIYQTDWADISADADENTFYVVLPDPE